MASRIYCRIFQGCVKIGNCFMGYRTPKTMNGAGCLKHLPAVMREEGVRHAFIVSGPHISKSGLLDGLKQGLEQAGIRYTVFSDLSANPTDIQAEAGLAALLRENCDAIIAVGGGSPMDCAKVIAARYARRDKSVAELQGLLTVRKKLLPFYAVPTTAVTGSETTLAAVITVEKTRRKASVSDPALFPKWAVLDPELTLGLSPAVTAATGMDALCHAVECYTNHTYCTKTENAMAKEAAKLILDNLYECTLRGDDIILRAKLQMAAFYAGRAFTRGCVGYVHACGHPLSALYGLPHGVVMGALLPKVLRAYGTAAEKRLAELADYCGIPGATRHEKAQAFIARIEEINRKTGLPEYFPQIRTEDIPLMAEFADREANPLYPVPVIWSRDRLEAFYKTLQ